MARLAAVGNLVFDIIETPYARSQGRVLSGCSTNSALAYAKLGGKASLLSRVGREWENKAKRLLEGYGIEAHLLPSEETGGFRIKYLSKDMRDRELIVLGVADRISPEDLPESLLSADAFVIGPILGEVSSDLILKIRRESGDKPILVDPQGLVRRVDGERVVRVATREAYEVIKLSSVFKPNEHEAEVLFPEYSPMDAAARIRELGAEVGVVTVAEKGSYIASSRGVYHIPAYGTREVDPTGCGDVYAGAMAYYMLRGEDPVTAAAYASAAASYMVEYCGPEFPLPRQGVEERAEAILEGVRRVG
ncbi:MAG: ribokinase [Thermoproteota archaeon]|nr:MAG: ribokinase [Candidatus Korarchaeota archaeon]